MLAENPYVPVNGRYGLFGMKAKSIHCAAFSNVESGLSPVRPPLGAARAAQGPPTPSAGSRPNIVLPPSLRAEFSDARHVFGTVSMARTADPHSASSQFFICFAPAPHLDGQYTVFGQLVDGEEAVRAVERGKSDHDPCAECGKPAPRPGPTPGCCGRHHKDRPAVDVVLKKVTLAVRKS